MYNKKNLKLNVLKKNRFKTKKIFYNKQLETEK